MTLPASPASACSLPIRLLALDDDRIAAGAEVRVSAEVYARDDGSVPACQPPIPPPPTASAEPTEVSETAEATRSAEPGPVPGPVPTVTLPPLRPVAYAAGPADPGLLVTVTIAPWTDWRDPAPTYRTIAEGLPPNPLVRTHGDVYRWAFAATVTIPADVAPGRYYLHASQPSGVYFGRGEITVVRGLSATGGDAAGLARAALLSILSGLGALALARRAERSAA